LKYVEHACPGESRGGLQTQLEQMSVSACWKGNSLGSKGTAAAACMILVLSALPLQAAEWRHRDIWLKNELGERISSARNAADAYSPRKTCGTCHGYTTITSGYHFQQGFDEMGEGRDPRRPWDLSPGLFGKGCIPGIVSGRVASKKDMDPHGDDLSAFDWIGAGGKFGPDGRPVSAACGWTHPGGGPLEYGRKSDGKPDFSRTLLEGERLSRSSRDGDYSSRSTPDGRSHFRESGVVEGDCLLCHLPGYRMERRNGEIGRRNYRWAATAGAGLGEIRGAVFTYADPKAGPDAGSFSVGAWNFSQSPGVDYFWKNSNLFTKEGKLRGRLIRKQVGSQNCLQCHRGMDARKTGTLHEASYDVHIAAGLQCTDCHPLTGNTKAQRLRHQVAKGFSPEGTVKDRLDGVGMMTCAKCHLEGRYRPTRPGMSKEARNPAKTHAEKFPRGTFHFSLLHCSACHSTAQHGRAIYLRDAAAGEELLYTADRLERVGLPDDWSGNASAPWQPWITRYERVKGEGERYIPCVTRASQWFGEKLGDGRIRPIALDHVRRAAKSVKGLSLAAVRNIRGEEVKETTVATDEDIRRMIRALSGQGFPDVVFVSDRVYALREDRVVPFEAPAAAPGQSFPAPDGTAFWFGERQEGGEIKPISLQYVLQAFRALEGITMAEVKAPRGGTRVEPDVSTGKDIRLAIRALEKMSFHNVVFIAGRLYELRQEKLISSEIPPSLRPPAEASRTQPVKWFGERQADGSIRPIGPGSVRQALSGLKGLSLIEVKNEWGRTMPAQTVATEADIRSMIGTLTEAGFKNVVLVGRRLYEVRRGTLISAEIVRAGERPSFAVHHNVVAVEKKKTYGAKGSPDGCLDCHNDNAPFFAKLKILHPGRFLKENYPTPKEPNAEPQMYGWGIRTVPAHE